MVMGAGEGRNFVSEEAVAEAQALGDGIAGSGRGMSGGLPAICDWLAGERSRASALLDWVVILAALSAVAACYAVYMIRLPEYLNSDQAAEILTAREILRQKTLFLREWYFSTEIFIVRTSLFMALWGLVTDSFLDTFRLAAVTDVAVMCAAFAYMMKRLGADARATVLGMLVFFGIRGYFSGQTTGLGGSTYGTLCATTFTVMGYYVASRLGKKNGTDRIICYAIPALAFLFGISSVRFVVTVLAPLLAAHVASKIWSWLPSGWRGDRILREILVWIGLSVAGWMITAKHVIPFGFGPADYGSVQANGLMYIFYENLAEFLREFFHYNQVYTVVEPFNLISINGMNGVFCLLWFMACGATIIRSASPCQMARRTVYLFLSLSISAVFLSLLLLQPTISVRIRYFVFFYAFMGVGAALGWKEMRFRRPFAARLLVLLVACLCVTNSLWNVRNIPSLTQVNMSRVAGRHVPEIEESFERHGISRGFALFWDSGVETVLSDGRIEVLPLTGDLRPLRYLAPYSVFTYDRAGDATAFLKVRLKLPPEIAALPQFNLSRPDILDLAYDIDLIQDQDSDIEIYYFERNPFTFPPNHNPAEDYEKDMEERRGNTSGVKSG
jgi:hypothetical protein